jgi:putative ABC transport system permease protein
MRERALQLLLLALRNLIGYPLRSLLTAMGVVFGVGSVIAMMALGAGMQETLLAEFGRLGLTNIILNSREPATKSKDSETNQWAFHRYGLTYKDERQIRDTVPDLDEVLPVHTRPELAWNGSSKAEATLYGVDPRHMELFGLRAARGRILCGADAAELRRVCAARRSLFHELKIVGDPLGMSLLVGDEYYVVVGILEDEPLLDFQRKAMNVDSKTKEIYVPYTTFHERLGTRFVRRRQGSRQATDIELSQIVVRVRSEDDVIPTVAMLQRVLDRYHGEDDDYEVVVPLKELTLRRKTQEVLRYALIAIASISLLVGGIGIANIMLATVTERTREIGIRRALGARRRHIVAQFLTETTVISTLGGILGIGVGYGMSHLLAAWTKWPAIITLESILLAVSISMGTGMVSGLFPARRAALLDPIAALRHE